jgi:hypothetical protein
MTLIIDLPELQEKEKSVKDSADFQARKSLLAVCDV